MSKICLFVFVTFLSVVLAVSTSYASTPSGKGSSMTFDDQNLIGATVIDRYGGEPGTIIKVIKVDRDQAEFAVVLYRTHDKYGNAERRFITIPVAALMISETRSGRVTTMLTHTQNLKSAPFFDPARIESSKYDANVYRDYGVQPSWTDNGMGKSMKEQKSEKSPYFNWEYIKWQYMWE